MRVPRIFRLLKFARLVLAAYKQAYPRFPKGGWMVSYIGKGEYCENAVETDSRAYDAMNCLRRNIGEAVDKCGFRKEVCE